MNAPHFIYLWFIDGHFCCFYILTIMSNTGINHYVQVFVWTYVFISLESIPQRGRVSLAGYILLGHKIILCFVNWGTAKLFSKVSVPFYSCGIIQYVSFCDWLISYIIMSSRFIHVVAHFQFPSFLRLIFHCMDISYSDYLFVCWWTLGLIPTFGFMNNITMDCKYIPVTVHISVFSSFGYIPRSGIAGSYNNSINMLNFLRKLYTVFQGCCIILLYYQ